MTPAELQTLLEKSTIPPALWPRLIEREKYRQIRLRTARQDEAFIKSIEKMKKNDEIEREKQREFTKWLFFLCFLLDEEPQQKSCISFLHNAYRQMWDRITTPKPICGEGEFIERSFCAIALTRYPEPEVIAAMGNGIPCFPSCDRFKRGQAAQEGLPMRHSIKTLHEFRAAELTAAKEAEDLKNNKENKDLPTSKTTKGA